MDLIIESTGFEGSFRRSSCISCAPIRSSITQRQKV